MPKFENLEPYLDPERKGKVTPVAPYHSPAQTYQPSDTATKPHRSKPLRQRTLRLPKVKLSADERISTDEMEKAYKAAVRKEKVRAKRRPGQNPFSKLLKKLASLFTSKDAKKKTANKRSRNRRGDDRKPNDRAAGGRSQKKGARNQNNRRGGAKKGAQNRDAPKDGTQKKSSNRSRRPRKDRNGGARTTTSKPNGERSNRPRNTPKQDKPAAKPNENAEKPKTQSGGENAAQEPAKKNRRNRRNRSRRPSQGGHPDGPSRSEY